MNSKMDSLVRLNAQTTGRDKLFRLCQYSTRLLWAIYLKIGADKDTVNRLKDLEYTLSSSRKLLLLGRSVDVLYSAFQTIRLPDHVLRLTLTLSRISSSFYLMCDHLVWFGRVGLLDINKKKWTDLSMKFWMYAIMMNLIRDAYELLHLLKVTRPSAQFLAKLERKEFENKSDLHVAMLRLADWVKTNKSATLDTLKNLCDVFIPATALGHTDLGPGTIGFLGTISSAIALMQIVDFQYRLSPS